MRFIPVDGLPIRINEACKMRRSAAHYYDAELDEFMQSGIRVAKVEFDPYEFKSAQTAYGSLNQAIKRSGLPINSFLRGGEVYLMRTDM